MLSTIRIRNFQAHELREVEFGENITAITGGTDSGKSSIVRALTWGLFNRPTGDSFIRHGADFASVVITTTDGHTIKRKRGKKGNLYILDGKKYKAFGNEVPKPIQDVLALSHINLQEQHDSPFWFSQSPGEVSRELNQIIDLGDIDTAMDCVARALRSNRAAAEVSRQRLEEAEKDVARYSKVPEAAEAVGVVHKLLDDIERTRMEWECLRDTLSEIATLRERAAAFEMPDFSQAEELLQSIKEQAQRNQNLRRLIEDILRLTDDVSNAVREAQEAEEAFHNTFKGTCPLCGHKTK